MNMFLELPMLVSLTVTVVQLCSIYMSDKVQSGWKYNQLAEYWKEEKEVTKSIVRTDADPLFYSIDYKGKPSLEPN